jgi:hypothetical protein
MGCEGRYRETDKVTDEERKERQAVGRRVEQAKEVGGIKSDV